MNIEDNPRNCSIYKYDCFYNMEIKKMVASDSFHQIHLFVERKFFGPINDSISWVIMYKI